MENGYENLFNAIWSNAVDTDTQKAAKQLFDYAFDAVYETYSLTEVKPLDRNDEKFKDLKSVIHRRSKKMAQKLVSRIKELVYEESKEWPNNSSHTYNDPEYDSIFKHLKEGILVFAQNEMRKFQESNKLLQKECIDK